MTIITFFFLFVLVFISISAVLALAQWWFTRPNNRTKKGHKRLEIEQKMDRLKERAFVISIIVTFFFVTPFFVIYLFVQ